jgi:hypothetical protein
MNWSWNFANESFWLRFQLREFGFLFCFYGGILAWGAKKKNKRKRTTISIRVTEPLKKWGVYLPRSYRGILGKPRIHKHNTYKHTIPYKVQVKIITYYFHVLELQDVKLQRILQKISQSLTGSVQLVVIRVITSPPSSAHYTSDRLQHGFHHSNLDFPLTAANDIAGRGREKSAHNTEIKSAKLEQLRSVRLICHDPKATNSRHAKGASEITDLSLLAPTTNHF